MKAKETLPPQQRRHPRILVLVGFTVVLTVLLTACCSLFDPFHASPLPRPMLRGGRGKAGTRPVLIALAASTALASFVFDKTTATSPVKPTVPLKPSQHERRLSAPSTTLVDHWAAGRRLAATREEAKILSLSTTTHDDGMDGEGGEPKGHPHPPQQEPVVTSPAGREGVEESKGDGGGAGRSHEGKEEEVWRALNGTDGWAFQVEHHKELQDRFFGTSKLIEDSQVSHTTGEKTELKWMGADVSTSIQIGPSKYLWLFGDTLVGKEVGPEHFLQEARIHAFPRQTVALVDMLPGTIPSPDSIKFYWRWTPHEAIANLTEPAQGAEVSNFFDPTELVMKSALQASKREIKLQEEEKKEEEADKSVLLGADPAPAPAPAPASTPTSPGKDPISESKEEGWYWAHVGVRPDPEGPLVLLASISLRSNSSELGFDVFGSGALLVRNPDDPPQAWVYEQVHIPGTTQRCMWATAITVDPRDKKWAYIVGNVGHGFESVQTMGRVPTKDLVKLDFSNMEVWAEDIPAPPSPAAIGSPSSSPSSGSGKAHSPKDKKSKGPRWLPWSSFLGPSRPPYRLAKICEGLGVSEASLYYHTASKRWYLAHLPGFVTQITLFTAPEPSGPWTPNLLLDIPSFESNLAPWNLVSNDVGKPPDRDKLRVFYAAKIHPELAGTERNEIVLTYCGNVFGAWPSPVDYTPRFVRIRLKKGGAMSSVVATSPKKDQCCIS